MTKPDDVPQDTPEGLPISVWLAAMAALGIEQIGGENRDLVVAVGDAIMAETERCAQVISTLAEVVRDEVAGDGRPQMHQSARAQVNVLLTAATAIRNRS